MLSSCLLSLALASPVAAQQPQSRAILRCESNGSYTRCPAVGSWRGARLVQQLSQTPCLQGRNWGFDRNAVWVNDGCRGVFDAGDPYANVGERVTCASVSGGRTECPADTRYGATLVRTLSTVSCSEGRTWGTTDKGIWVDRGCRGEFEIGGGAGTGTVSQRVTCGASTRQRVTCTTTGTITSARLTQDLSGSRCRQNVTWGYYAASLWIKDGCIGHFKLSVRESGGSEAPRRHIVCGSSTGQRTECRTEGYATQVRLVTDLSGQCKERVNWGHTDSFIWTNRGCRARFEVTYRAEAKPHN